MTPVSSSLTPRPRAGKAWLALAVAVFGSALLLPARGDELIWSALLLATNEELPKPSAPDLEPVRRQVEEVFGYKRVQVIGAAIKPMDDQFERWLVPSQHFWFSVKSRGVTDAHRYQLTLEMFQDRRRLVETEVELGPESPLFIRGPMHAKGQLIIVLKVLPDRTSTPPRTKPALPPDKGQAVQVKGR